MKVTVLFSEFGFLAKDAKKTVWYKCHFEIGNNKTAWFYSPIKYNYGDSAVLTVGRDKDGRAKVCLAH